MGRCMGGVFERHEFPGRKADVLVDEGHLEGPCLLRDPYGGLLRLEGIAETGHEEDKRVPSWRRDGELGLFNVMHEQVNLSSEFIDGAG